MKPNQDGFILLPALLFTALIALWTVHSFESAALGTRAAGNMHNAIAQLNMAEARLTDSELRTNNSLPISDDFTSVDLVGCLSWDQKLRSLCTRGNLSLYIYWVRIFAPDDSEFVLIESLYASPMPPAEESVDRSNRRRPAPSYFLDQYNIYFDPTPAPRPHRLAWRQHSVF